MLPLASMPGDPIGVGAETCDGGVLIACCGAGFVRPRLDGSRLRTALPKLSVRRVPIRIGAEGRGCWLGCGEVFPPAVNADLPNALMVLSRKEKAADQLPGQPPPPKPREGAY